MNITPIWVGEHGRVYVTASTAAPAGSRAGRSMFAAARPRLRRLSTARSPRACCRPDADLGAGNGCWPHLPGIPRPLLRAESSHIACAAIATREIGVHRVESWFSRLTLKVRLAQGVRDPRRSPPRDQHLQQQLVRAWGPCRVGLVGWWSASWVLARAPPGWVSACWVLPSRPSSGSSRPLVRRRP